MAQTVMQHQLQGHNKNQPCSKSTWQRCCMCASKCLWVHAGGDKPFRLWYLLICFKTHNLNNPHDYNKSLETHFHQTDNKNDKHGSVKEAQYAGLALFFITWNSLTKNITLIRPDGFCGCLIWHVVHKCHYHPINADCCCDLQTSFK